MTFPGTHGGWPTRTVVLAGLYLAGVWAGSRLAMTPGYVLALLILVPLGGFLIGAPAVAWDRSERRRAEKDLKESVVEYQSLFDNLPVSLFVKEAAGLRYVRVNRTWEQLQGHPREDIIGKSDLEFFSAERAKVFAAEDRAVLEGGLPLDIPAAPMQTRLQGERILHTIKVPVLDAEGEPRYVLGISEDITERAFLESKLQQSQKMESLGVLAGGVAHDMNNILGAILGLASAHLVVQPADSPAHHAFETIAQAATRGGEMVKSLLGFARQHPAELEVLDLNALLREEVRLLEHTTLSTIRLELDLAEPLPPIRGDASALAHALMNLCVNAVDAMSGKGTLSILTRTVAAGWVEVQVRDTGCGMDAQVLGKALDPFFTTKEVGKGTGLGLSMVYTTVKAHHGQMELQSEPGAGALVKLRFPAWAGTLAVPAAKQPAPGPARPSLRVLVVDDDELVREATQAVLEILGHTVTTANSGEASLALLQDGCPVDLLILDLNMPGLGGAATLPRIRALRPGLPVLLATGRTDQTALDLVANHPGVTLLAKPFSLEELRRQLEPLRLG